jgi:hypothetical protein
MRRIGVLIVVLTLGLSILPPGSPSTAQFPVQPGDAPETSAAFVPGQLLVRFRPAVTQQQAEQLVEIEGVQHLRRIEALDTEVLQLPPGLSVPETIERFAQYREVEVAEPNHVLQVARVDDPGLGNQWAPQQIEAPAAHAHGDHVYLAGRTVELVFGLFPRYRVFAVRSTDGGSTWGDLTILAEHIGFLSGAYGVSLAGVGDRLYLGYEYAGTIYFRHSQDGVAWTEASNLGSGHWPSVTQVRDGQGGILWESEGNLLLRHYMEGAWAPAETVLQGSSLNMGYYPNLKSGASGERLEWVFTHCSGSPFRLVVDGRPVTPGPPPVSIYLPIVLNQKR